MVKRECFPYTWESYPTRVAGRPERRVCALCGTVYVVIVPTGLIPDTGDNLCAVCLMLPTPPIAPYEKRDSEGTTA